MIDGLFSIEDKQFFIALCKNDKCENIYEVYFVNAFDKEFKSIEVKMVGDMYDTSMECYESTLWIHKEFSNDIGCKYAKIGELDITCNTVEEYCFEVLVSMEPEKIRLECTIQKKNLITGKPEIQLPILNRMGKQYFCTSDRIPVVGNLG